MEGIIFLKGFILGISISAPLGPMGVLCIQRTMNRGIVPGLMSGLGIAIADTFYAIVAGFGLTFISDILTENQLYIRAGGSLVLLYLGYRIFVTNPAIELRKQMRNKKNNSLLSDFLSTFFITASNPLTIIFFGVVFASLSLVDDQSSHYTTTLLVVSIFLGAALWWGSLSWFINRFRSLIKLRNLWWINKITGVLIVLLGIGTMASIFFMR